MMGMLKFARVVGCLFMLAVLNGCMSYHTNTKQSSLRSSEMMQFTSSQPIALQNVAPEVGETIIGKWVGWKVYGDYHKYTESCVNTLKAEFQRRGIPVAEGGGKSLDLKIISASSRQGAWLFEAKTTLWVKTGGGLERQYEGRQNYGNGYGTTAAIENAMGHCIEQMLNDKDIVDYLRN